MTRPMLRLAAILLIMLPALAARAETPEEWVQLGTRIHRFFGRFIPVGIRIGLDAQQRLKAGPRGLTIVYYEGAMNGRIAPDAINVAITQRPRTPC